MQWLWIAFAGVVALATGRSVIIWTLGTYLFGWIMLIPLVFMGPKVKVMVQRMDKLSDLIEKQNAKNKPEGYQEFETVDDLFKQLESK